MINPIKCLLLLFLMAGSTNIYCQSIAENPFYAEFTVIESDFSNVGFETNQFGQPGLGLRIGYQDFIGERKMFYDFKVGYSFLKLRTELDFVEPFGIILTDVSLNNLNFSGNIGYRFSKFGVSYGLGVYKNHSANSRVISKSNSEVVFDVNEFQLVNTTSNFQSVGLRSSIGIGYFITDKTELKLTTAISFVEGRNPLNANGIRYISILEFGVGIRQYLF